MSRAKAKKKWTRTVTTDCRCLPDDVRVNLGYDLDTKDMAFVAQVEWRVTEYFSRIGAGEPPRDAHVRAAIIPIKKAVDKLSQTLFDLDQESSELLYDDLLDHDGNEKFTLDRHELTKNLVHLRKRVEFVLGNLEKDSRQAVPETERNYLIKSLCKIFDVHHKRKDDSELASFRLGFVETVLDTFAISYPESDNLVRLFPFVN